MGAQWDGSFELPKQWLKPMDKEIFTCSKFLLIQIYDNKCLSGQFFCPFWLKKRVLSEVVSYSNNLTKICFSLFFHRA